MRGKDVPSEYLFDSGTSGTHIQCHYYQAGKIGCSQSLFFLAVFGIGHLLITIHFLKRKKMIHIYIYISNLAEENC